MRIMHANDANRIFKYLAGVLLAGIIACLPVAIHAQQTEITIQANKDAGRISRYLAGACIEDVNHEIYGGLYSQMIFGESFQEPAPAGAEAQVSGMWRLVRNGAADGKCALEATNPFTGTQSQRLTLAAGKGEFGIENQGLNRWGMNFVKGKPYEGCLWVRAEKPAELFVALESRDGAKIYTEKKLKVTGTVWQRLDFTLTPNGADKAGRLVIKLKKPGSVVVGYAFLQPGAWGRFKSLPVRRDVAEGLRKQGITILRYGGSMINAPEYRWKKMIGSRDRRPPYKGTWYPYSSNGWGILDFLNLCEAAGFAGIPTFNMDETPQDMADFIQYVNGPAKSLWGRKRVADGHPAPYKLRYLELGNEERVDENYFAKFKPLAEAIWARDPSMILVVGDFVYDGPIGDPMNFKGAASKITSLAAHQKIMELARRHNREVWFDIHVNTDGPDLSPSMLAMPTYVEAIDKISGGAKHKVAIFELNAQNRQHRRALANAWILNVIERLNERVAVVCSANGLQPDGQNDNGWDQGLLFLNPSQVWLQSPGYVTQMISRSYQPRLVAAEVKGASGDKLSVNAKLGKDGRTLTLQVVNLDVKPVSARIRIEGFTPKKPTAAVTELAGALDATNTAASPKHITPKTIGWQPDWTKGSAVYSIPPASFTEMEIR